MKDIIFISDLHLAPERSEIIDLFIRFIHDVAAGSEKLYILGDFLEYWIGDDDKAEGLQPAFDALKTLSNTETEIFFMHGNRDFLVGSDLAKRCGFSIIEDPATENINNKKTLLMHGDSLCTDDIEYQKFRTMVRDKKWQHAQLSKPLSEREQIARSLREQSQQAIAQKATDIMDVNLNAVIEVMKKYETPLLIHGHTHRPAIHHLDINGQPAKRVVLGDWYRKGSYLKVNENDMALSIYE